MKKVLSISMVGVLLIALGGIVFADGFSTPAEIYANLTGKSVEEVYEQRSLDKTFGQLAEENGLLEEFQKANLENKKAILQQRVEEGIITQEQADEIIKAMEDGCTLEPGTHMLGREYNLGFGRGNEKGSGYGRGYGKGNGKGNGQGRGFGRHTQFNSEN